MNIICTPDERFTNLPEYDFQPHYMDLPDAQFGHLRMHYLDEGPSDGRPIILLHGQGCWAYMFRHMIPLITDAGYRVICPDYIGFGRSDKLPDTEHYSFNKHVGWLKSFFFKLRLSHSDFFMFDWGGFFGLRIAAEEPAFFNRIALSNTQLPTGNSPGREWFINWRTEQFAMPRFPQGEMVNEGSRKIMPPEIIAAFDSPYPEESFKTGPRRFPMILPITPDMDAVPENIDAWKKLGQWQKPVLTLFSEDFKGTAMGPEKLLEHIPGCRGQNHALLKNAGFYIVEDKPGELAQRIVTFVGAKNESC
jgi:haloalkane dehalogenase